MSSPADEDGWITGPALEIGVVARAIRPGDRIILKDGATYGINGGNYDGCTFLVVDPEEARRTNTVILGERAVCFACIASYRSHRFPYAFAARNIAAWKPKTDG